MNELLVLIKEILANLADEGATLKSSKIMLEERIFANLPQSVEDSINIALGKRTRENFSTSLLELQEAIAQAELDEAAAVEIEEITLTSEIERLEYQIAKTLEAKANSDLTLGRLLCEAREAHDDSKSFLAWCDERFSFKKAWVYRLMQASTLFSSELWAKTPVNYLYTLRQQATEEQWTAAEALVKEKGSLALADLRSLLGEAPKPVKAAPVAVKADEQPEAVITAAMLSGEVTDVPVKMTELREMEAAVKELGNKPEQAFPTKTDAADVSVELLKKISELTQQNIELNRRIEQLTLPTLRNQNKAPSLHQFKSRCMYARLGLSADEATDSSAINGAFRELVKAGYGIGHESFDLLNEAKQQLLEALKVAA